MGVECIWLQKRCSLKCSFSFYVCKITLKVKSRPKRTWEHPSPHPDTCLGIRSKEQLRSPAILCFFNNSSKAFLYLLILAGMKHGKKLLFLFSLRAESWYISETADKTSLANTYNFIYKNIPAPVLLFFSTVTEKEESFFSSLFKSK